MGLLDRAAGMKAGAAAGTPAAPVPPAASASASPSGLLRRTQDLFDEGRILQEVASVAEGLEAPARLFAILQRSFRLSRAALLFYDPLRMVFAPWASIGFDETTCHRLRIPLGFNQRFNRVAKGETLTLREEQELADFSLFFSAREFAAMEELILLPMIFQDRIVALLLITALEEPLDEIRSRRLQDICAAAAPLIYRARESRMERLPQEDAPETAPDLEAGLRSLFEECRAQGWPLALIRIDLSGVMEEILRTSFFIDDFRLEEDLTRITGALLADIGRVFRLRPRILLLAIHRLPQPDPPLLLHQISLSLKGFFLELAREQDLRFDEQVRILTPDSEEVGCLAAGLL